MRSYLDCFPCFLRQALRIGEFVFKNDEEKIKKLLDGVAMEIPKFSVKNTPPEMAMLIYDKIAEISEIDDPYKDIKKASIEQAKKMLPFLREKLENSEDKLLFAAKLAIAGNIIDFGYHNIYDIEDKILNIIEHDLAINDFDIFKEKLQSAKTILYIGDNCGESVFDKVFIENLPSDSKVYYAVRGFPIINDVTYHDALDSELSGVAEIIDSGVKSPGAILKYASETFKEIFSSADIVISKGQGNFEALSDEKREIFFFLMAKCSVIAKNLNVFKESLILKYHSSK